MATNLQLASAGLQDIYLTQQPSINWWNYVYYKYVNFGTEIIKLQLNEVATFNKKTTCIIPKKGHLLSNLSLHLKLPALVLESGTYLNWVDTLGYAIFAEPIELEIGGIVVDKLYPRSLDIQSELNGNANDIGKCASILKSDNVTSTKHNAERAIDIVIPLDFWFTKESSLALPLLSMHTQDVRINFKFKDFSKVVNYDGNDPQPRAILDSNVFAEYIYLDDTIAEAFENKRHVYIIEQTQFNGDEIISANVTNYNSSIKFNHPIKEILFGCALKSNVDNNNHYSYNGLNDYPIISEASLMLDGRKVFDYFPEVYFRTKLPQQAHTSVPMKYIYCIPFSLHPEKNQPAGSINFSNFNDPVLSLRLFPGNADAYLYTFAINYNIVIVEDGALRMEFAS